MRRWRVIAAVLSLSGCIPADEHKPPPKPPAAAAAPGKEVLQCFADLKREGVQFRALPDRYFENGCSAAGAVQLLDIGTPVPISER